MSSQKYEKEHTMKLSKLKTVITVLSGIFIFSLPFINDTSIVKAAWDDGYSDNIVQGSDGSLSATFIDKSATSDTRFKTMGYTITVKDPDTGATIGHAHVAFDGVDHTSMSPDGTKKFTQDSVSAAQVQAAFGALIDDNDNTIDEATTVKLYEQYMSGKANIQFDSIIAITTDGFKTTSASTHYDDASKYAHFVMNSEYAALMKKYGDTNGDGVFSVSEMAALQKIFPDTDFSTHYNKKLVTTIKNPDTKEAEEAQAKIDEASKSVETEKFAEYHTWDNQSGTDGVARSSSSPYYVTYNDSRKYSENGKSHEAFTNETTDLMVCIFLLKIKKI